LKRDGKKSVQLSEAKNGNAHENRFSIPVSCSEFSVKVEMIFVLTVSGFFRGGNSIELQWRGYKVIVIGADPR